MRTKKRRKPAKASGFQYNSTTGVSEISANDLMCTDEPAGIITFPITIDLPEEFIELCRRDLTTPERVLCGFIADLCGIINWQSNLRADGYSSNGSDERDMAEAYYNRVGYPYEAQWIRKNQGQKPCCQQCVRINS